MMHAADDCFSGSLRGLHLPNSLSEKAGTPLAVFLPCAVWRVLKKNMHTDDFFHYLSKGAIPPHLPESNKQNLVVIEAFLEAAKRYARGGYDVIVDGIVGPWFLEPWKALAQEDYEVHYIVLRASKKETMKRAVERSKLDRKTNIELVETMWEQFSGLGIYESNVIDTTTFTIKDTVSAIKERVACGTSLLS